MKRFIFTVLMVCYADYLSATEIMAPELHIDPFINPLLKQKLKQDRVAATVNSASVPAVEQKPRDTFLWQPELRGIIRSEDIAIANMGGEMVELGKTYEGFRLIRVKERSVVFEKNGKQYPVSMDDTSEEDAAL